MHFKTIFDKIMMVRLVDINGITIHFFKTEEYNLLLSIDLLKIVDKDK